MDLSHSMLLLMFFFSSSLHGQERTEPDTSTKIQFFEHDPEFNPTRFYTGLGVGTAAYGGTLYGLSQIWYKDSDKTKFQFFNDAGEWNDIDKMGHAHTAYMYSRWISQGSQWSGVEKNKSIILGSGASFLFQLSFEIMDGFNEKWGFSIPDVAANSAGIGVYAIQEAIWDEQRIYLKFSAFPRNYSSDLVSPLESQGPKLSIQQISNHLYGEGIASSLLKDYNNQTYWLSINPSSFLSSDHILPKWLNIAFGTGSTNMFGGFNNTTVVDGYTYSVPLERKREFYFSLDIDWERIGFNKPFFKTLGFLLNSIKTPAPTLSIDSNGVVNFHLLFF